MEMLSKVYFRVIGAHYFALAALAVAIIVAKWIGAAEAEAEIDAVSLYVAYSLAALICAWFARLLLGVAWDAVKVWKRGG